MIDLPAITIRGDLRLYRRSRCRKVHVVIAILGIRDMTRAVCGARLGLYPSGGPQLTDETLCRGCVKELPDDWQKFL